MGSLCAFNGLLQSDLVSNILLEDCSNFCKMFHSPGYQRTGYGAGFKVFAQCGNIGATASVGFLIQNVTEKYIGTSRHIAREVRVSQLSFRRNQIFQNFLGIFFVVGTGVEYVMHGILIGHVGFKGGHWDNVDEIIAVNAGLLESFQ